MPANAKSVIKKGLLVLGIFMLGMMAGGGLTWYYFSGDLWREPAPKEHKHTWAAPVELPGVPKLYIVSADFWRSAQPNRGGFRRLADLGVRTVINVRDDHRDTEQMAGTGMELIHIPMVTTEPNHQDVRQFIDAVRDADKPLLVHCHYGADRTGLQTAIYRIAFQGWTVEQALAEMTRGGFGFHGIYEEIPAFLRSLDAGKLRTLARGEPLDANATLAK
ncbi:MAG: fused DSP-PTPase phosphatase/NAD kinase-like protein [Phycisphaerae bacterium]